MSLEKYLQEVKERCESATEGPWKYTYEEIYYPKLVHNKGYERKVPGVSFFEDDAPVADYNAEARTNHRFIAHARQDVPKLVALVELLSEEECRCHEWPVKSGILCQRCDAVKQILSGETP